MMGRSEVLSKPEVILTAPATEMSTHHGKEFMGFGTCTPTGVMPNWLVKFLFYPKVKCKSGIVKFALYGLRKIESVLIENGFNVATVHPYDIERYLRYAKAVGISVMDPLGFGPASMTFASILGGTPTTKVEFISLMEKLKPFKGKIIVGGPGAWQFEWDRRWMDSIDCVVVGESEEVVPELFERALNGKELPKIVTSRGTDVEEIPTIKNPSVNGLIEVSRGCGRGCRFCSETVKRRRDIPLQRIVEEAKLNVRNGTGGILLHAEDVLLYGCKDPKFVPNEEKVLKLFQEVKKVTWNIGMSHCSLSAVASKPSLVERITELLEIGEKLPMLGVQTGLETGSPRVLEKYMRGKALPFHPNEWREVAETAFAVMHDNLWIPAVTLLICLPEERDEDVIKTIELIEDLRDYRSLIVPLVFIPMEVCALKGAPKANLRDVHWELLYKCMDHDMRWVDELSEHYLRGFRNAIVKFGYKAFAWWVKRAWRNRKEDLKLYSLQTR